MRKNSRPNSWRRGLVLVSVFVAGVLATTIEARAVILYSTPTRNTNAPSSDDGLDAWNLQATWGSFLATPIDATHFITAQHVAPSSTIRVPGADHDYLVDLTSRVADPGSDLCVYSLQSGYTFSSYAPLYNAAVDGSEVGKALTVIGRGMPRGNPVMVGSDLKGWQWTGSAGTKSWGRNVVSGFDNFNSASVDSLLYFNFDSPENDGIANESALSAGDSSGGVFINVSGQWKLAGINYAVSGPFSYTGTGTLNPWLPLDPLLPPDQVRKPDPNYSAFNASIYDAQGLYYWGGSSAGWVYDPNHEPGGSYASRISDRLGWIQSAVPEPGTLVLLSIFIAATGSLRWLARRRTSA